MKKHLVQEGDAKKELEDQYQQGSYFILEKNNF